MSDLEILANQSNTKTAHSVMLRKLRQRQKNTKSRKVLQTPEWHCQKYSKIIALHCFTEDNFSSDSNNSASGTPEKYEGLKGEKHQERLKILQESEVTYLFLLLSTVILAAVRQAPCHQQYAHPTSRGTSWLRAGTSGEQSELS